MSFWNDLNTVLSWKPPLPVAYAIAVGDGLLNVCGYVLTTMASGSNDPASRYTLAALSILSYVPAYATVFFFTKTLEFKTGAMVAMGAYILGLYLASLLLFQREPRWDVAVAVCGFVLCGGYVVRQAL